MTDHILSTVSQGPTKEQAEGDFAAGVQSIEELKNVSPSNLTRI